MLYRCVQQRKIDQTYFLKVKDVLLICLGLLIHKKMKRRAQWNLLVFTLLSKINQSTYQHACVPNTGFFESAEQCR